RLRARRKHTRGLCREALEVTLGQRAARREEGGQAFELRLSNARIDIRKIELAAGKGDVPRSIRTINDAVEPERFDPGRFGLVGDDERATLDRRDGVVRMKAA